MRKIVSTSKDNRGSEGSGGDVEENLLHAPTKSKSSLHLVIFAIFYMGFRRSVFLTTPFATQD